jgi:iron complex outermembrane receptor protein
MAGVHAMHAQDNCGINLKGRVFDETTGNPLNGATVVVVTTQQQLTTDAKGRFALSNVCKGNIQLALVHPECSMHEFTIAVYADTVIELGMDHHDIDLHDVVIQGAKRESHSTQQTDVISGKELDRVRGLSLGESLKKISGVYSLNTGATISKPVIHGLHSNRVLILNNGVRQEGQQWGSEHAPEIDPFIAKRITVIKGANSLKYGSDALGGVILVEPDALPALPKVGGEFNFAGFSNNAEGNFSLLLEGNHVKVPALAWRVQGTYRRGGNSRAPQYWMKNTGIEEGNFSAALGWKKSNYGIEIFYSYFNTRIGILSASHIGNITDLENAINAAQPVENSGFSYVIGRPYQLVNHQLAKLKAYAKTGDVGDLNIVVAWQNNVRKEYDKHRSLNDSIAALNRPGFQFSIQTITADIAWQHKQVKGFSGTIGVTGSTQTNSYLYGYFIPDFLNFTTGAYVVERWIKGNLELEGGLRLDYKWQRIYGRSGGTQVNKVDTLYQFISPSGNVGLDYHINENVKWNVNVGTAWRAPNPSEQFSNGLHHGAATYEKGDRFLKVERSAEVSTTFTINHKIIDAEIGLYHNYVANFIYLKPVQPPTLTVRGAFPTYRYTQANVSLTGADIDLRISVLPIGVRSKTAFASVYIVSKSSILFARNLTTKDWLEQMPPLRFDNGVRIELKQFKAVRDMYLGVSVVNTLKQYFFPVSSSDYAMPPKGYFLLNAEVGFTAKTKNQDIQISLSAENILNTKYRDYLDRFRYFTDSRGVNVALRIKVPFDFLNLKNEKHEAN